MTNKRKSASASKQRGSLKNASIPSSPPDEDKSPQVPIPENVNPVIWCAARGCVDKLTRCFEDPEDPYNSTVEQQLHERDQTGKSALDIAALVGHVNIIKELTTRGFDVNDHIVSAGKLCFFVA